MATPAKSFCSIIDSEKGCMSSEEFIKIPLFQDLAITSGIEIPNNIFVFVENFNTVEIISLLSPDKNFYRIKVSPLGIPDYHPSLHSCFLC